MRRLFPAPVALVALVASLFALAVACGGDFDPGSRVSKLRVLAVRSNAPFARPGETVGLSVLVVDPAQRHLSYGFALCRNPRSSSVLECLASADPSPLTVDDRADLQLTVPDVKSLGIVVAACPGALRYAAGAPLPFVCEAGGRALSLEEFELGIKRVFVRARDRNENPSILRVTWDEDDWPESEVREAARCDEDSNHFKDCPTGLSHRISVDTSAPETGVDESGATFRERQIVEYYASEGTFEFDVKSTGTPETRWVARRSAPDEVRVWIVVRDDRGGVTWTERRVRVR